MLKFFFVWDNISNEINFLMNFSKYSEMWWMIFENIFMGV